MEIAKGHEFILVNYGSDLELREFVEPFDIIYKEVDNEWNISRGKNISHSLGSGDILFCLDADTYILEHGMDDLNKMFKPGYYFTHPYAERTPLAMWREDYYKVDGWNEDIKERGEDMDMAMRLQMMGIMPHCPRDSSRIIKHIDHD